MLKVNSVLKFLIKDILSATRLRRFVFPRWRYNFSASDLVFMCGLLENNRRVDGAVLEVGCEYGETTIFFKSFLNEIGVPQKYICIDTFDGFVDEDVAYEVEVRGKSNKLASFFKINRAEWFRVTMSDAGFDDVLVFKADASKFDFSSFGPISFVLIDVDLYHPVLNTLRAVYSLVPPGGIIVVDDCNPQSEFYDGAYQAFLQFCAENDLQPSFFGSKLGYLKKVSS